MKKFLVLCLSIFTASLASASQNDYKAFTFNGGEQYKVLTLEGEKTHIEYRRETVAKICYRTVHAGFDRFCSGNPRTCTTTPRYVQQPYTCYVTESVPYVIHDYYITANVTINFANLPQGFNPNIHFSVSLDSDDTNVTISAKNAAGLIVYSQKAQNVSVAGYGNRLINTAFNVSFKPMGQVISSVLAGVQNMKLEGNLLSFVIGKLSKNAATSIELEIEKSGLFGSEIFQRILNGNEYSLIDQGNTTLVVIDVLKLTNKLKAGKKYEFEVKVTAQIFGNVINSSDLPSLKLKQEIKTHYN
ncbi:MAG: hypothetical protein U0T83_04315 [Bacteriovoracaceae bacterium]